MARFQGTAALAALIAALGASVAMYAQQGRVANIAANAAANVTSEQREGGLRAVHVRLHTGRQGRVAGACAPTAARCGATRGSGRSSARTAEVDLCSDGLDLRE